MLPKLYAVFPKRKLSSLVPHNLELNFLLGKTAYNLGNIEDYAEYISNLEILCENDCEEINNLKLLAE